MTGARKNSARSIFGLLGVGLLLSGCVNVQHVPLAPSGAEALRGREVTIAAYQQPDFFAMTAARAAIGGLIGGAIMTEGGRNVVTNHNIQDPAPSIARALGEEMKSRHQVRLRDDTISVDTDDPAAIARANPGADMILELRTVGWGYSYYPTQWNRYRVLYSARLRLLDLKKAQVLAEGFCARPADEAADAAPTGDELLANGAQRLKQELGAAANFCVQYFRSATFALADPSPTAIAAAAPAPADAPRAAAAEAPAAAAFSPITATSGGVEIMFWESIRQSSNPADYTAYLEQYPQGSFAALARNRLSALGPSVQVSAAPAAAAPATKPWPSQGDTWTYRLTERNRTDGPKQRNYVVKVASASVAEVVEHFAIEGGGQGEWKHKGERQVVPVGKPTFSPYLLTFGPMPTGPLGRLRIADPACGGAYHCEASGRVVTTERIRVPAGTFDTVKVEIQQSWRPVAVSGQQNTNGGSILTGWYSPAVKRVVKVISRPSFGYPGPLDTDFELELASYQLQ